VSRRLLLFLVIGVWTQPLHAGARLAIVIDDIGYSAHYGARALELPGAVTLAILPHTNHGATLSERAHRAGKEIILHVPMSNSQGLPMDAGGLDSGMDRETFLSTLRENLASVPHIRGINNHMGSLLTSEARPMGWLMEELGRHQLFFVDSRTSSFTLGYELAQRYGIPSAQRDVFLDNERDPDAIARQLDRAVALAHTHGSAIAIGHPYPETLAVLESAIPQLAHRRIELVPVSTLLKIPDPGGKNARCLAPPNPLWYRPAPLPEPLDVARLLALTGQSEKTTIPTE
jgi:uncharacterized protein